MEKVKDRMKKFLCRQKLSQEQFAEIIGKSRSYVNSMSDNPSATTLKKIREEFPALNTDWLLNGKGEMLHNSTQYIDKNMHNSITVSGIRGKSHNIESNIQTSFDEKYYQELVFDLQTEKKELLAIIKNLTTK